MTDAARRHDVQPAPNELLSRLLDGDVAAQDVEDSCRHWQHDERARATWHSYQMIGDVLRSDELASNATRDARFLAHLRTRLAAEPVPLAPAPLETRSVSSTTHARESSRRWLVPVAVAAGFVVVGAAVVVLSPSGNGFDALEREQVAATAPADGGSLRRDRSVSQPAQGQTLVINGQLIRDARLDAYFEAHRGAVGAMPSATPGGALRSVEILVPER